MGALLIALGVDEDVEAGMSEAGKACGEPSDSEPGVLVK
jgi:hypothetical protein